MKLTDYEVLENRETAAGTFALLLSGDNSDIVKPGQFVNIALDGFYLRRPLSVSHAFEDKLLLIYKVAGTGTAKLSKTGAGETLNLLTGLGNGFDTERSGESNLLIAGGAGVAPMYWLAEELIARGKGVTAAIGFRTRNEIVLERELRELGAEVIVSTEDGSAGYSGYVTGAVAENADEHDYVYVCGPEAMMRSVYETIALDGQYSFEERMACAFGACMGCSCETLYGSKRICRDGPVLYREEIVWR